MWCVCRADDDVGSMCIRVGVHVLNCIRICMYLVIHTHSHTCEYMENTSACMQMLICGTYVRA